MPSFATFSKERSLKVSNFICFEFNGIFGFTLFRGWFIKLLHLNNDRFDLAICRQSYHTQY